MSAHKDAPWMDAATVAERVRATQAWVERSARSGVIPRHKIGMRVRFCEACIAEISAQSYRAPRQVRRVTTSRRRRAA